MREKNTGCKTINFLFYASTHLAVYMLVAMTIEKYSVLRNPLKSLGRCHFRLKQSYVVSILVFVLVVALNIHHLWTAGIEEYESSGCFFCGASDDKYRVLVYTVYPIVDTIMYCLLPTLLLIVFNALIIRCLSDPHHVWRTQQLNSKCEALGSESIRRRHSSASYQARHMRSPCSARYNYQAARMTLVVTFAFIVCIIPVGIITMCEVHDYFWSSDSQSVIARRILLLVLASNLMYTHHAINFWLYCASGSKFRGEFRKMVTESCSLNAKQKLRAERSLRAAQERRPSSASVIKNQTSVVEDEPRENTHHYRRTLSSTLSIQELRSQIETSSETDPASSEESGDIPSDKGFHRERTKSVTFSPELYQNVCSSDKRSEITEPSSTSEDEVFQIHL